MRLSFNKAAIGWIAIGLLLYLGFLVVTLPASWLAWGVTRASHGNVIVTGANGTLWKGNGELHVHGATTTRQVGRIGWQVNPFWLLAGRAHIALDAQGAGSTAHTAIRWGGGRLIVSNLDAALPAHLLGSIYAPAGFFAPTGELRLSAAHIEINHEGLHGNAEVRWNAAGGRFTELPFIGDYLLLVTGKGEVANIGLSTLRGSLELTGQGQWRLAGDGEIRFNGTATARADQTQLEPLLHTFGKDLGDGRRPINFSARAPLINLLGL